MYWSKYNIRSPVLLILGIFTFILAIQLMMEGSTSFSFILDYKDGLGPVNTLGFGWLFSYLVLSGSPVAASAITLLESGSISEASTFMMINGSRLGASFIVLGIGLLYMIRGRERKVSISIGLLAFIATATIYTMGILIGYTILFYGLLDFLEISEVMVVGSVLDLIYVPIVAFLASYQQGILLFGIGLLALLASFKMIDMGMPRVNLDMIGKGRWKDGFYNKNVLFAIGSLVTLVTMSVSVSLSLLVPLSVRGQLKHEKSLPYIMGANITTFADTLLVAVILGSAVGVKIVLIEIISITIPTLIILMLLYSRYEALQLRLLKLFNSSLRALGLFVGVIFLIPLMLFLI